MTCWASGPWARSFVKGILSYSYPIVQALQGRFLKIFRCKLFRKIPSLTFDVPISKMLVGYWVFVSCLTRCEYLNATLKPLHLQEKKMAAGGFKGRIPIAAALQVFFLNINFS